MNLRLFAFMTLALCFCGGQTQPKSNARQTVIDVTGPTVIAFFKPADKAEMQDNQDTNEALSDFQLSTASVRDPLSRSGIKFCEVYSQSIRLRVSGKLSVIKISNIGVGYLLITPGRKLLTESGVMTDSDLLQASRDYFRISIR